MTSQQSVVVEAHLTPEEKEDGNLNDIYQPIYKLEEEKNCAEAVTKYRTIVIPTAEKATFPVPKSKFLFLAYRGIADCDLASKNFIEAEQMFQKLFDYLPTWPGIDDSDYPINFESIGMARMGQQRWKDAEQSLLKATSIFDEQIEKALRSDSEFVREEHANNVRISEDFTLNALSVVYFREDRSADALATVEKAYNQAVAFHAPAKVIKQIVDNGEAISIVTGSVGAAATWLKRSLSAN